MESEKEERISDLQNETITFLVNWAGKIEMEFLSFKQTVADALRDVDFNQIPKSKKDMNLKIDSKLEKLKTMITSLTTKSQNLELEVSNLFSKFEQLDIGGLIESIQETKQKQDIIINTLNTLTSQLNSQQSPNVLEDLADVKYFLKLLLPRTIQIEENCQTLMKMRD